MRLEVDVEVVEHVDRQKALRTRRCIETHIDRLHDGASASQKAPRTRRCIETGQQPVDNDSRERQKAPRTRRCIETHSAITALVPSLKSEGTAHQKVHDFLLPALPERDEGAEMKLKVCCEVATS